MLHEERRWTRGLVKSTVQRFRIVRGEACYDVGDMPFRLEIGEEQIRCLAFVVFSWKEHGFSFLVVAMGRGIAFDKRMEVPRPAVAVRYFCDPATMPAMK